MPIRMTLQKKIILIATLGLLVVIVAFGSLSMWALRESTERSLQERLLLAKVTAEHIDLHHKEVLDQLRQIAASGVIDLEDGNLEPEKKALDSLYASSGVFSGGLFLLDKEGHVLWNRPYDGALIGADISNYPSVEKTYQTGEAMTSGVVFDNAAGKPLILYTVPVMNKYDSVTGVIGGGVDLTTPVISEFIETIKLGKTGYAQVVDERGVLVASTKPEKVFGKGDHGDRFVTLIQDKKAVVRTCHNCHEDVAGTEKRRDVLAFAPLSTASWGVAVRQSEEEALAPTRSLGRNLLLVGVIALVIASMLMVILARRIIKPVKLLTSAAQRIATGDLGSPVPPMGEDEIGRLGQTFDAMRVNLNRSRQEIEQWNTELENKVSQRTRELSALFEISRALTSTLDLEYLLKTIVTKIVEVLEPADAGALLLYDAASECLVVRAAVGFDFESLSRVKLKVGEAIPGRVFQLGQPMLFAGPEEIARGNENMALENRSWYEKAQGGGPLQSLLCAPLILKNQSIGCILLHNSRGEAPFVQSDLGLLQTLGHQIAIAIENVRLYEEVQAKEQLRGQLLEKVITAQEEERKRIARELHDEAGQALTALMMTAGAMEQGLSSDPGQLKQRLAGMKSLTAQALDEIHGVISDLRPTLLDDVGLVPALRWYIQRYLERSYTPVDLRIVGLEKGRLSGQVETALFRIIQEALTNIAKHAHARSVSVHLQLKNSVVAATISDDGSGFNPDEVLKSGKDRALGLEGMRERAALLGGALSIKSKPGQGTKIFVEIPVGVVEEHHGSNTSAAGR